MDSGAENNAAWAGPGAAQPSPATALSAVMGVLRRRWQTLVGVALAVFGAAIIAVLLITPRYEAFARVRIDPSPGAAMGQMNGDRPDQAIIETEVSSIHSRAIAEAVSGKLRLANEEAFVRNMPPLPADATPAQVAARENAITGQLLAGLQTQRNASTYIINIGYRSTDPQLAARVANAFADAYVDANSGRRTGTAEKQTTYLDKRLAQLSQDATAADARLAQYRAQAGIVQAGGSTVTDQQISPLAGQLATAESEAAAARSKLAIARSQIASGGLDAVSAVLNSSVIGSLRAQRAQLVQKQGEVETRYGPKHPESVKVAQQLDAIDKQIDSEAHRVIGGLQSEASAASARAASLRGDMGQLRGQQASDTRASVMADSYQRQADAAHAAYNRLAEQAQATSQIARSSLSQVQVIEQAEPPSAPSSPHKRMLLVGAMLLALLAGTGTIAVQELLAKGLRTVADVERLGIPVLATVPRLQARQLRDSEGQRLSAANVLLRRPMSSYAEAFRLVRRALLTGRDHAPRTIAIVSSLPDEGKTISALSLARIMALSGEKTLVIDTDLRRAGLREASGVVAEQGLVEVLRDGVDADAVIRRDEMETLDILPVAAASFLPQDLFSDGRMRALLDTLAARYDRIVIDTAPLLGVADARAVAGLAEAVVMVIKWGDTPVNAVRSALSWLDQDDAPVAGALLSMVDVSVEAYGALYYSRKYAQYYRAE